ncbi:MAG: hypothetical protein J6R66_02630 [Clostridia bacterium]|nr:hypothetical protein [Clostridia bacterium]
MRFPQLYGHETVKQSLSLAIANDRISNAYVFEGIEGVGKKLCAKIFSQALVCQSDNAPCGVCPACIQARANTLPDIIVPKKDKDSKTLGVEEVRQQIIAEAYLKPRNTQRKIFIIEQGDELSPAAQNALLKVLEEPPSYVTFIICVTSKEKLLPTVLSRSQVISFFPLPYITVAEYLTDNHGCSQEDASVVAKLSRGSIGAAVSFACDTAKKERIDKSVGALINLKKNSLRIREMVEFLTEEKENIEEIIDYLLTFLRDCVLIKTDLVDKAVFSNKVSDMRVFTQNLTKKKLIAAFDKLNSLKIKLKQNLNFNATVSETVMRIWEDFHDEGSGHKI